MATSTMICSKREMMVLNEGRSAGTAVQQSSINDFKEGSQSAGIGGRSPLQVSTNQRFFFFAYGTNSFLESVVVLVVGERFFSRQELPKNNTKRIDVCLLIKLFKLHHLRSHPSKSNQKCESHKRCIPQRSSFC